MGPVGPRNLRASLKRVLFYSGRMELSRTSYDTDLTDAEWEQLAPLVPPAKAGGRPPKHSRREILNGIFYAVRSGGAWKLLPHDLPPWRTVYHYFWSWRRTGVWQQIHDSLREQVREAAGRNPNPSAAILDSQSIRTSEAGGVRGYDGGKKIRGRKRHILVDTLGLLLLVVKLRQDGVNRGSFAGKLRLCLLLLMIWPAPVSCLSNGERHGWAVRKFPTNSGKRRSLCTVATRRPSCAASCV